MDCFLSGAIMSNVTVNIDILACMVVDVEVFIHITLMNNDIEDLFMCFFPIPVSLVKYLYKLFFFFLTQYHIV
jgi:hypothetical protein